MKYIRPILIDVVMNLPIHLAHCRHCKLIFDEAGIEEGVNKDVLEENPADVHDDFIRLAEWIQKLSQLYRHRIAINLIDIKSFLGVYKSIVHRLRTYPAFIVNKKDVVRGWDWEKLEEAIDRHIQMTKIRSCEIPSHT